jgi:hypothetical protein
MCRPIGLLISNDDSSSPWISACGWRVICCPAVVGIKGGGVVCGPTVPRIAVSPEVHPTIKVIMTESINVEYLVIAMST